MTIAAASAAQAATEISSSAYGISSNLNVLHVVSAQVGPLASVSGTAPSSYNLSNTVASANQTLGLGVLKLASFGEHLKAGVITSTASSPYMPTPTGTATSTIANLSSDLNEQLLGKTVLDILGISATAITSTSSVSGIGAPSAMGDSTIAGLKLTGSVFKGFTFDAAAVADAAPNTVLFDALGLKIILNEQTFSGDGVTSEGIATNAFDVMFSDFLLGGGLLSGDLVIGHSQADISGIVPPVIPPVGPVGGVPEPTIWAELIAGFGLTGSVIRRQREKRLLA